MSRGKVNYNDFGMETMKCPSTLFRAKQTMCRIRPHHLGDHNGRMLKITDAYVDGRPPYLVFLKPRILPEWSELVCVLCVESFSEES
jgi:hypothetical protein